MTIIRNYNEESLDNSDRQYAYNFDFDVMHHFMMKSFQPFFKKGNVLELGSYQGDFTTRLLSNFDDITCVEGSDKAIETAKKKLSDKVKFINTKSYLKMQQEKVENLFQKIKSFIKKWFFQSKSTILKLLL